ncbi:MAG TPA: AI-2E family transporter, partial [Bacteroidia bacterium]|nr:AI-2E family transporter [Bacteroidia bacterium]
ILLYIIVAAILTMILRPLDKRLERVRIGKRKVPRALRAISLLLLVYVIVIAFISIFIPLIANEINMISQVDKAQVTKALHEPISQLEHLFQNFQQDPKNQLTLEQYTQQYLTQLLNVAQVSTVANGVVSIIGSFLVAFFSISFFTFFFIKDGDVILHMLLLLIPVTQVKRVRNVIKDTQVMLTKYFTGVLIDVLFVFAFVSIGMSLLGVQNALIIGLFAGIMNIIPYVGPLIGGTFAIIVGISTNLTMDFYSEMMPLAIKIFFVFVAMNLTDAFLVQPFIFSKRVKAHPLEIFTVILVAGSLAGIGGMVAAVPVYTVLRIILREFVTRSRFVQKLTDELDDATPQL